MAFDPHAILAWLTKLGPNDDIVRVLPAELSACADVVRGLLAEVERLRKLRTAVEDFLLGCGDTEDELRAALAAAKGE